jgi:hypothetical protein
MRRCLHQLGPLVSSRCLRLAETIQLFQRCVRARRRTRQPRSPSTSGATRFPRTIPPAAGGMPALVSSCTSLTNAAATGDDEGAQRRYGPRKPRHAASGAAAPCDGRAGTLGVPAPPPLSGVFCSQGGGLPRPVVPRGRGAPATRSRPRLCRCRATCLGIVCGGLCGWSRPRCSAGYPTQRRSHSRGRDDHSRGARPRDSRRAYRRTRSTTSGQRAGATSRRRRVSPWSTAPQPAGGPWRRSCSGGSPPPSARARLR